MNNQDGIRDMALQDRWSSFMDAPSTYADPLRLVPCFGGELGPDGCARLLTVPRLSSRLSKLILRSYNLSAEALPEDRHIVDVALSNADQLRTLALRAGAIYWSNTLAGTVLSSTVREFTSRLGDDLWMFSLQHRELGGPEQTFSSVEEAVSRLKSDGWRCLSAWCNTQSDDIGRRVRLKLPPDAYLDAPADGDIADLGPSIVRAAV